MSTKQLDFKGRPVSYNALIQNYAKAAKLRQAGYDSKALEKQIQILKENDKLTSTNAFDRPYINDYITKELKRLNVYDTKISKDFKVLEFFGNDQRWYPNSDLVTHPDEVNNAFLNAETFENHIALNLDDYDECLAHIHALNLTNKYDVIICSQVLCYSYAPLEMLSSLYLMLKKGGHLICTTSGPCYPDHYGSGFTLFYTLEAIENLIKKVFGNTGLVKRAAYGNAESAMRTFAYVDCCTEFSPADFKKRSQNISIIVAATGQK